MFTCNRTSPIVLFDALSQLQHLQQQQYQQQLRSQQPKIVKRIETEDAYQIQIFKENGNFDSYELKVLRNWGNPNLVNLVVESSIDNFKKIFQFHLDDIEVPKIDWEYFSKENVLVLNIPKKTKFCEDDFTNAVLASIFGGNANTREHQRNECKADVSKQESIQSQQKKAIEAKAEQSRREAEQKARDAELAKKEAEKAREAELKAKKEAELKFKREAELKAKKEAEQKANKEAELKAKKEAEQKAKKEAELKAKKEAEQKAKKEAELKEAERLAYIQEQEQKLEQLRAQKLAEIKAEEERIAKLKSQVLQEQVQREQAERERSERVKKEKERRKAIVRERKAKESKQPQSQPSVKSSFTNEDLLSQFLEGVILPQLVPVQAPKASQPIPATSLVESPDVTPEHSDTESINTDISDDTEEPKNDLKKHPSMEEIEDEEFVMFRKKFGH